MSGTSIRIGVICIAAVAAGYASLLLALVPPVRAAGGAQPNLAIRTKEEADYDDIADKSQKVEHGQTATYRVRLTNAGDSPGSFSLNPWSTSATSTVECGFECGGVGGVIEDHVEAWDIAYSYRDSSQGHWQDWGPPMGRLWTTRSLDPGDCVELMIKVTPTPRAPQGDELSVSVEVASDAGTWGPEVSATTTVQAHQPDLYFDPHFDGPLPRFGELRPQVGGGVYNTTAIGQTQMATVESGQPCTYVVVLKNAGNAPDTFEVTVWNTWQYSNSGPQWAAHCFEMKLRETRPFPTGHVLRSLYRYERHEVQGSSTSWDGHVTWQVTLNKGAVQILEVEVTPNQYVPAGGISVIPVTAVSTCPSRPQVVEMVNLVTARK